MPHKEKVLTLFLVWILLAVTLNPALFLGWAATSQIPIVVR